MALERNPEATHAMLKVHVPTDNVDYNTVLPYQADWEIASHGFRWIDYQVCLQSIDKRTAVIS